MKDVHLRELDLNLLLAFNAIFREGSVTKAAAKLGVTQPAMSHMLERLRASLGDPLFVRTRNAMVPTERAQQIAGPLADGVAQIERALRHPESFDPRSARRAFHFGADDYAQLVLLPALAERLADEAPQLDLVVNAPRAEGVVHVLESGAVDFIVAGVQLEGPGIVRQKLFRETFTCLVRRDHPASRGRWDVSAYARAAHVVVSPTGRGGSAIDALLRERGLRRRVAVRVPHFLVAPLLVARTDLVLTAPKRLAAWVGEWLQLVELEAPVDIQGYTTWLYWHERHGPDGAHRWLRERLVEIAKDA